MTGVSFTWVSTNPSVASVPGTAGATQTATAVANGVTSIQATAQGATGSASLTVAQVPDTIVAGPSPIAVGQGGSAQLVAHALDSTGHTMAVSAFVWSSDNTLNVIVGPGNGVITGVGVPFSTANVVAKLGPLTSNPVAVTVDNNAPARISWGHDTLAIGRGSLNNSLPLYLSKVPASAVTINVAVRDTFAFFSPTSVVVPASQVTANANLNGRNAGTTEVRATDAASVHAGDSAVLLVQASAHYAWGSAAVNATDFLASQLILSDPAPAGGVYVASVYGTPGIAQLSPDPAFVPAGQLAANVNVNGVATGTATVTPSAPGMSGTAASITVYAATLTFAYTPRILGAGQYDQDYIYSRASMYHPLLVNLVSSDSTIATQPATVTIPASTYYVYFNTTAPRVGTATQTASAPGWTSGNRTVIVTTPHMNVCCTTNLNTTSATSAVSVAAADSQRTQHLRINPLFVTLTSTDPTVVAIVDTTVTIGAGAASVTGRFKPGGSGGTAYVKASAGGHTSDSVLVIVAAPQLGISFSNGVIGVGQQHTNYGYVSIPNSTGSPVAVTLTSSDSSIAAITPTVTIPGNSYYAYFDLRGHRLGKATITATATGYSPVSTQATVSSPRLGGCCTVSLPHFAANYTITQNTEDSVGTARAVIAPLVITFRSTDSTVAVLDSSSITMAAGTSGNSTAKIHVLGVGTASIIASAPGYAPDTVKVTVITPVLNYGISPTSLGLRQRQGGTAYVYTPNARPESVVVHITNPKPGVIVAPDSVKIPPNTYYQYFDYSGVGLGKDTLTFTAAGYAPATVGLIVTTPQLHALALSSTYTTTQPPVSTIVQATDTAGSGLWVHYTLDTVAVLVSSTDSTVMKSDSAIVHLNKGTTNSNNFAVRMVGPGQARLIYRDSAGLYRPDSTNVVTVTGPSLHVSAGNPTPVTLGMRQHMGSTGMYVYTDNNVTGTPLTVSLQSSDPTVATVPATITIPVGTYYAYFDVTALDITGTIRVSITATGYAPTYADVQVGHPQFLVAVNSSLIATSPPQQITVYAEDQAGNFRYPTENVAVSLNTSNTSVAGPDSATVTILKDNLVNSGAHLVVAGPGTATLAASDARTAFYKYTPFTTPTITVGPPTVQVNTAIPTIGLDQGYDTYVYTTYPVAADLSVTLSHSSGTTATTPSTVIIAAGSVLGQYRLSGVNPGSDVITASATGYLGTSATVTADSGKIVLVGWPTTMKVGDVLPITLYTQNPTVSNGLVLNTTTFTFGQQNGILFQDASGATITTIDVPQNGINSNTFYVKAVAATTGTVQITGGRFAAASYAVPITP